MGNNAAVLSLQNGPVVEGDVKVMFESSAVSVSPASSQIGSAFMFLHSSFQGLPKGYEDVPFYFWFNTSFVENNKWVLVLFSGLFLSKFTPKVVPTVCRLFLSREELDNPHKPKTWDLYKEDFGVTLFFSEP